MRRCPLGVLLRGQLTCSPPTPRIFLHEPLEWKYGTTVKLDYNTDQKSPSRDECRGLPTVTLSTRPSISASIRCDMRNSKDRRLGLAPSSQGYEHLPYFRHNLPTSGVMQHAASERPAESTPCINISQPKKPAPLLAKPSLCTSRPQLRSDSRKFWPLRNEPCQLTYVSPSPILLCRYVFQDSSSYFPFPPILSFCLGKRFELPTCQQQRRQF
jgi:hypothetical protein